MKKIFMPSERHDEFQWNSECQVRNSSFHSFQARYVYIRIQNFFHSSENEIKNANVHWPLLKLI